MSRLFLIVASLCLFGLCFGQNSLILVLNSYTSTGANPTCGTSNFFETVYEFPVKDTNLPLWCTQTPTSFNNYLFVYPQGSATVQVQVFGPNNQNCSGTPLQRQNVPINACVKLAGDNPVVSYKITTQNGTCSSCSSSQTCCWAPGQANACVSGQGACCCPDFQNACDAGTTCACGGVCPGPGCQCVGCVPKSSGEGLCTNQ